MKNIVNLRNGIGSSLGPTHEPLENVTRRLLTAQGEPDECIDFVARAISGISQEHGIEIPVDLIVDHSIEMQGIIKLKAELGGKLDGLIFELISAYVWIWHCGGSEDYGFPGPARKRPARETNRTDRSAQVIPFYKSDCVVQK